MMRLRGVWGAWESQAQMLMHQFILLQGLSAIVSPPEVL